ncbi:MAG: hypothetical protein QXX08_09805, partial [Candidatus Bathyarchaeia archaeon]
KKQIIETIPGEVPSLINLPSGCPFHPRCKYATEKCSEITPRRRKVKSNREVSCLLYEVECYDSK